MIAIVAVEQKDSVEEPVCLVYLEEYTLHEYDKIEFRNGSRLCGFHNPAHLVFLLQEIFECFQHTQLDVGDYTSVLDGKAPLFQSWISYPKRLEEPYLLLQFQ